ncbi:hypothetical protein J4E89_010387 [Alternaria sp. Ai002NY15]|nr:hypothetical protein J4E89_010387 [Alternaria sp. Ai002NY15]
MDRDFVQRPNEDTRTRQLESWRFGKAAQKLDDELNKYIATHAKPECMTLSEMMQSKLPRELRDMVYAHLLPRETYSLWHFAHDRQWLQFLRKSSCDHVFMGGYLLSDTMKEIGELWYERSTFVVLGFLLGRGSDPKLASEALDFLEDDGWGLDINVYQHVKHIYIRLDYTGNVHDKVDQLKANLRKLTSLGANARVVLQLQCTYSPTKTLGRQQVVELVKKLRIVFPVLEELVKGGKRVMVNVKGYNVFDVKVEKLNAQSWISQLTKVLSDKDLPVLQL